VYYHVTKKEAKTVVELLLVSAAMLS